MLVNKENKKTLKELLRMNTVSKTFDLSLKKIADILGIKYTTLYKRNERKMGFTPEQVNKIYYYKKKKLSFMSKYMNDIHDSILRSIKD